MAGTVITDLAWFLGATSPYYNSNCDQITDWSGTPTPDTVTFIQGSGALSAKVSKALYESVFTLKSDDPNRDIRGKAIYVWAMCSGRMDTHPGENGYGAGSGFRIRVYQDANWGEWDIAGRNTWAGGWTPWAVHTDIGFSRTSATPPDKQYITKVGVVLETVGSSSAINFWWDALRIGTYIGVKGGTEGSPANLQDIMDQENLVANKWGVLSEYEGLFLIQGKLIIGSTTSQDDTYFKDTSGRILIFPDRLFPSDFYEIKLQGNSAAPPTYYTKIFFGEKVGGSGVSGITVRASSSSKPFKVTSSDTNITEYGFYGCVFYQAAAITLQAYSTLKEFLDCSVVKSAEMLPSSGIVKNCTFSSSTGRAIRMGFAGTSHHISDSKFINCQTAMHVNFSDSVTINNMNFYGNNPYDIEHSITGALTVNYTNCPSPPLESKVNETGAPPGTTTILASVTLTVRHVKTGNEPTEYARCYIEKTSDHSQIMNQDATEADDLNPGYYKATMTYTATGIAVTVRARESGYLPFETGGTITDNGIDVTAVWLPDPNY